MGKFVDLIGQKYGRLTVIERKPNNARKQAMWKCKCDCGNDIVVASGALRKGNTRSCGCFKRDETIRRSTIHGHTKSHEFTVWAEMINRCSNPNHKNYADYGGRGISVADEWKDFNQFLNDMGIRPSSKHTLDRIDNNKGYSAENCRWATQTEQTRNRRIFKTNKTGIKGVFWNKKNKNYNVSISVDKKQKHIGTATTIEEAKQMREEAELKYCYF